MIGRRSADNGTDFHAFSYISRVIELRDLTRCKTNLVAVRRVSGCRRADDGALRKLAGERFGYGNRGVCRAGYTHGLIDIAASGERIADGSADTRCRAAKRFNLGGVVMSFVLKEKKPVFIMAVDVDLYFNGAGIYLFGLIQSRKDAAVAQVLGTDGGHIPKRDSSVFSAKLVAQGKVFFKGLTYDGIVYLYARDAGVKGGMPAVIRPVGVNHADFGNGWVAVFLAKIVLAKCEVRCVHSKAACGEKIFESRFIQFTKAVQNLDIGGLGNGGFECFRQVK